MENAKRVVGGLVGNMLSIFSLTLEDADHLITIVMSVLGFLITFCTCVVIPVWKKIHKALEDKKITPDEAQDILDTTKKGLEDFEKEKEEKDQNGQAR